MYKATAGAGASVGGLEAVRAVCNAYENGFLSLCLFGRCGFGSGGGFFGHGGGLCGGVGLSLGLQDRKSTRLNSSHFH